MIRFGIMGAGRIAHTFCKALLGTSAKLTGVASRDLEKALLFQKEYGIPKIFTSYQAMVLDPDIDCVYIATPHGLHFEHIKLCLEGGKAVLCEKAFTLSRKQAQIVLDMAKAKHLFIMEAMWTRFLPVIQNVKKAVDAGEIGEVRQMDAAFGFKSNANPCDRLFNPALGGGALLDVGVYPITLANLILGVPTKIESKVEFTDMGVDATDTLTYFYPQAVANLKASIVTDMDLSAVIQGTKGSIRLPLFWATQRATFYDLNGKFVREINRPNLINGMEFEIMEVIRCMESGSLESSIMPPATTLEIMRQMDEIRHSWNFYYPQEKQEVFVDLKG